MVNQSIKRFLTPFPKLRKVCVDIIHKLGLGKFLGLNFGQGLYFHPQGGKIVETLNYSKPFDGDYKKVYNVILNF